MRYIIKFKEHDRQLLSRVNEKVLGDNFVLHYCRFDIEEDQLVLYPELKLDSQSENGMFLTEHVLGLLSDMNVNHTIHHDEQGDIIIELKQLEIVETAPRLINNRFKRWVKIDMVTFWVTFVWFFSALIILPSAEVLTAVYIPFGIAMIALYLLFKGKVLFVDGKGIS